MSESLRIVYGPGDEFALRALSDYLKEHGIEYTMLTTDEDMDHIMVDMPFGYMRADKFAQVIQTNGYLERNYGIQTEDLYGAKWQKYIHPEDRNRLLIQLAKEFFVIKTTVAVCRIIVREGFEFTAMIIINSLLNDENERVGFRVLVIDISTAFQGGPAVNKNSSVDAITQLPDRISFITKLQQVLASKRKKKMQCALILIGVQGIDKINQLSGYHAGDNFLRLFADALKNAVGPQGYVSRIESSKFAIIYDDVKKPDDMYQLAHQIIEQCSLSSEAANGKFSLKLSVGIAFTTEDVRDSENLLTHADEALRLAMTQSEKKIILFDEKSHHDFQRAAMVEAQLFNAISQNQFEVYYQPQIEANSEKLVGIEALIRWKHPTLGEICPEEFIAIAEDSGYILQIGKWMNHHALEQFEKWLNQFQQKVQHIKLSINLSPLQLMDENLIEDVSACLVKYNIPASSLILELTEEAVMRHPESSLHVLNDLKLLGIGLSMDDFGTGYSSLNYIRSLPINQIKIDRSFINAFQKNMQDAAVIKATILLADALGMDVVAEGVETQAELKFLRENGCQIIQGYYFSRPLDADAMTTYMMRHA